MTEMHQVSAVKVALQVALVILLCDEAEGELAILLICLVVHVKTLPDENSSTYLALARPQHHHNIIMFIAVFVSKN